MAAAFDPCLASCDIGGVPLGSRNGDPQLSPRWRSMISGRPAGVVACLPPVATPSDISNDDLEYTFDGAGEPVLFVHGILIADAFEPLLGKATVAGRYRLIRYRRRGYGPAAGCKVR